MHYGFEFEGFLLATNIVTKPDRSEHSRSLPNNRQ